MPKTLIAIPCFDTVYTDFMLSLMNIQRVGDVRCQVIKSSLIYDARNHLAEQAIKGKYDYVLWLDSDILFDPDLMVRMIQHMNDGYEYMSGLYFKRQYPTEPVIFKTVSQEMDGRELITKAIPYRDYPKDTIFPIDASGFGAVMMRVDLLKKVMDKYGLPFSPHLGLGEDLSFCWRAKQIGAELFCDSRIKLKHIGYIAYSEGTYLTQDQQEGC